MNNGDDPEFQDEKLWNGPQGMTLALLTGVTFYGGIFALTPFPRLQVLGKLCLVFAGGGLLLLFFMWTVVPVTVAGIASLWRSLKG